MSRLFAVCRALLWSGLALHLLVPAAWAGQEAADPPATRAEALQAAREAKARDTRAHTPNAVERGLEFFEEKAVFLLDREGFYPKLGTLTVGSGFSAGVGFRDRDLFENRGTIDVWAAGSTRAYFATEGRVRFPDLAGRRLFVEGWVGRRDYNGEFFFGLGNDSRRRDQSIYALRTTAVGATAGVRPVRFVTAGGGVEFLTPRVGRGNDDDLPNVEDAFGEVQAPGVTQGANFLRTHGFVALDYSEPRYARRGGAIRADFSHYNDRTSGRYTFNRLDLDIRQYFGFLSDRRVIALHGFLSTSEAGHGSRVPFYLMPSLGGNDTLRGYRMYRFRGPHALLLQAEYRWEIWSGLDAALFYDAGKTPLERGDLDLRGLHSNYGFGFRFNTAQGIIFRVDAGFGSRDGPHLYMVWGGVF